MSKQFIKHIINRKISKHTKYVIANNKDPLAQLSRYM